MTRVFVVTAHARAPGVQSLLGVYTSENAAVCAQVSAAGETGFMGPRWDEIVVTPLELNVDAREQDPVAA